MLAAGGDLISCTNARDERMGQLLVQAGLRRST